MVMAEIGLVRLARVAMDVARAAVPAHRSKYSKRLFTQPQLLGILCLMRYEDWTYREAEVRLEEHSELRAALGLSRVPDHTTLYRFLRRLDEQLLARAARRDGSSPGARPFVPAADGGGGCHRAHTRLCEHIHCAQSQR